MLKYGQMGGVELLNKEKNSYWVYGDMCCWEIIRFKRKIICKPLVQTYCYVQLFGANKKLKLIWSETY